MLLLLLLQFLKIFEPFYSKLRTLTFFSGDDHINNYAERGRPLTENNYYVDQYQDRKMGGYARNCGTLPMTKGGNTGQLPVTVNNLQGSALARSAETLDNRYPGKENVKRVSVSMFTFSWTIILLIK